MNNLIKLGKKLFPILRSLTGKGNYKSLKILKSEFSALRIKSFKSNTKVFDWNIPSEWNVNKALVKDKFNKKIIDFKKNNLHLVSYSQKKNKKIIKKELIENLYSNSKLKNAIPYVTSYYKKRWGFSISATQLDRIKKDYNQNDNFKVIIDSKFKKRGKMHYGEIFIPGEEKNEILISTNICHPSMANNELSGPLVAIKLAKYFSNRKNKRSLRIILIPETVGAIAYIKNNFNHLKKNTIGGYVITCIGDERSHSFLSSKYNNSLSDLAAKDAYKKLKLNYKRYTFLERGSDERQFNSPGINLGMSSIMRSKYNKFKEYHTSLDDFSVLTSKGLNGGYTVVKESIKNLMSINLKKKEREISEKNPLSFIICEPKLSKRGLYTSLSNTSFGNKNEFSIIRKNILNFIQYSDGSNSLGEISKYINLSLVKTKKLHKICKKYKFIN